MSRWFRFYDCALDDPKVQRLPPDLFKAWVNLLCVAARHDGLLPAVADLSFMLRTDVKVMARTLRALLDAKLLDETDAGLTPHNWNGRQFKSDDVAARVRKHREQKKGGGGSNSQGNGPSNGDETLQGTPPETDTEAETETDTEEAPSGGGESTPPTPEREKAALAPDGAAARPRGTPLPINFRLTDDRLAFARQEGLDDERASRELDKFRDYWLSAGGIRALKPDWDAAWRYWIRKAADDHPRFGRTAPGRDRGEDRSRLAAYRSAAARFSH